MGPIPKEHQDILDARAMESSHEAARLAMSEAPPPPMRVEDVPIMEWWDELVLDQPHYDLQEDGTVAVRLNKVTNLIEHPVPIEPPTEAPLPAPQALKLTKKVRNPDMSISIMSLRSATCHSSMAAALVKIAIEFADDVESTKAQMVQD
jgi:hypothetical protein